MTAATLRSAPRWLAAIIIVLSAATASAQTVGKVTATVWSNPPGTNQTFSFTVSYAYDSTQPELDVAMNNQIGGTNGCYFAFFQNPNSTNVPTLYLFDDNVVNWTPVRLATSDSASNSHCTISGLSSGSSFMYGSLNLYVGVSFKSPWAGSTLEFNEQAVDDTTTATSGWWQIPDAEFYVIGTSLGSPQNGVVTPSISTTAPNVANTFQITATDPNSWRAINEMDLVIGPSQATTNACYMVFFPYSGLTYLFSDDLSSWSFGGWSGDPWNSQCQVMGPATYASLNSTTAALTLSLTFTSKLLGTNYFSESVADQLNQRSAMAAIPGASFTVSGPLLITTSAVLPPAILSSTTPYSMVFMAVGGHPPYTWSATPGTLPAGMTIDGNSGTLQGVPVASGNFSPIITVTDSTLATFALQTSLSVANTDHTITPSALLDPALHATKPGIFRNGQSFLLDKNGNGIWDNQPTDIYFQSFIAPGGHQAGDVPVAGDWTGDGKTKVGVYRPSAGTWWLDTNNNGRFDAGPGQDSTYQFGGIPGDMPFVGDWMGTYGKDCIGIYRSQGSVWLLDLNCNGVFENTPADAFFPFGGLAGDVPVVGKWTGQGTRAGVVRKYAPGGHPQGEPFFCVLDGGAANAGNLPENHPAAANPFGFGGLAGDVFVSGDWYNTGIAGAGVYRAGIWVLDLPCRAICISPTTRPAQYSALAESPVTYRLRVPGPFEPMTPCPVHSH